MSANKKIASERAVLIGIRMPNESRREAMNSLDELASLTYTAGAKIVGTVTQELKRIDPATFIGKGKLEEIKVLIKQLDSNILIFNEDLNPNQNRNLEEALKVKVVDRTGLILDIFAKRAKTKEGKLQVELAQSLYLLPRLVGQWAHFSRQTGGIGTRGPGETQLEVDRRRVREKISKIRKDLEKVKASRELHRTKRLSVPIPTISLIGYTNAGKSTLFRTLTKENVLVEDKLFATLDPTVRRLKLPSGREVLIADTVGFISKLPHALVESFKATFEEIAGSDLLLHVVDVSHPLKNEQIQTVNTVLEEITLSDKPLLEVYNKIDLLGFTFKEEKGKIYLSAMRGKGVQKLLDRLDKLLSKGFKKVTLQLPHHEGALMAFLHRYARILSKEYKEDQIRIDLEIYEKYLPHVKQYRVKKGSK